MQKREILVLKTTGPRSWLSKKFSYLSWLSKNTYRFFFNTKSNCFCNNRSQVKRWLWNRVSSHPRFIFVSRKKITISYICIRVSCLTHRDDRNIEVKRSQIKTVIYGNSLISVRSKLYLEVVSGKRISDESKLLYQHRKIHVKFEYSLAKLKINVKVAFHTSSPGHR